MCNYTDDFEAYGNVSHKQSVLFSGTPVLKHMIKAPQDIDAYMVYFWVK